MTVFKNDHEENFGKFIPHFKQYNQLLVWTNPPPNAGGMDTWYGQVNWARHNSPALRSQNRWFLSRTAASGGGDLNELLAVAKYEEPNVGPTNTDIVLAFALLFHHDNGHTTATANYDLRGDGNDTLWNILGLDVTKSYTAKNLASSNPNIALAGWPKTGQNLYDNGIYVDLQGDNGQAITTDGALVQYIKLDEAPFLAAYGSINVAGTFNSWSTTADTMQLVADHSWEITISISATNPTFKFVADQSFSNDDWGDNAQTDTSIPIALQTGDLEGANISITGVLNGTYTFTFYDDSFDYKIEAAQNSAPSITMPGSYTTPVGFNWTRPVTVTDADGDTTTISAPVTPAGTTFTDNGDNTGSFSWTPSSAFENTTNQVCITANDGQGETNSIVTNYYYIVVPYDNDGDGLPDGWEYDEFWKHLFLRQ